MRKLFFRTSSIAILMIWCPTYPLKAQPLQLNSCTMVQATVFLSVVFPDRGSDNHQLLSILTAVIPKDVQQVGFVPSNRFQADQLGLFNALTEFISGTGQHEGLSGFVEMGTMGREIYGAEYKQPKSNEAKNFVQNMAESRKVLRAKLDQLQLSTYDFLARYPDLRQAVLGFLPEHMQNFHEYQRTIAEIEKSVSGYSARIDQLKKDGYGNLEGRLQAAILRAIQAPSQYLKTKNAISNHFLFGGFYHNTTAYRYVLLDRHHAFGNNHNPRFHLLDVGPHQRFYELRVPYLQSLDISPFQIDAALVP